MCAKKRNANDMDPMDAVLSKNTAFTVQEAYKALRTNVIFSLTGEGCKTIGITSSMRAECKSTTSLNLAISFGQLGKRVLLMDGDLRLPTVASRLGVKGTPGISDILVGQAGIKDCLYEVKQHGIYIMPSGNIPPDATRLLSSEQLRTLMAGLRKFFDYIIIDFPPVNTVTDAAIMSDVVDGYILVVRHQRADMNGVADMVEQMRRAEANILGFVYSSAPVAAKKYYGYYK